MKILKVSDLREFEQQLNKEEITYSRGVEILNQKIAERVSDENAAYFSNFELTIILRALEEELNSYADNSGRFKKYPTKGNAAIIVDLKNRILKKLNFSFSTDV